MKSSTILYIGVVLAGLAFWQLQKWHQETLTAIRDAKCELLPTLADQERAGCIDAWMNDSTK